MMKCEHMQDLLSPYVDGMCNHKEREILEKHLEQCADCRRELEIIEKTCALLAALDVPPVPEGFAAEVHRQVQDEKVYIFKKPEIMQPKRGGVAAVVAALAIGIGLIGSSLLPPGVMVAVQEWLNPGPPQVEPVQPVDIETLIDGIVIQQPDENLPPVENETTEPAELNDTAEPDDTEIVTIADAEPRTLEPIDSEPVVSPVEEPLVVIDVVQPQLERQYSVKARVADAGGMIQSLYVLSDSVGGNVVLERAGSVMWQDDSEEPRLVYLYVPSSELDAILRKLAALGIPTPEIVQNKDMTEEYREVLNSLAATERVMASNMAELTAEQQDSFEQRYQELRQQKTEIETKAGQVRIELYLMEEI